MTITVIIIIYFDSLEIYRVIARNSCQFLKKIYEWLQAQENDIDYFEVLALWQNDQLTLRETSSLLRKLFDPRCSGLECNASRALLNEWIVYTRGRFFTRGYDLSFTLFRPSRTITFAIRCFYYRKSYLKYFKESAFLFSKNFIGNFYKYIQFKNFFNIKYKKHFTSSLKLSVAIY